MSIINLTTARIQYVIITKCSYFQSPCLVKLSNRSNTTLDHLCFCLDHIVRPRLEMCKLLKILRFLSIFAIKDSDVILKNIFDVVLQNDTKHKWEHENFI